ncbi:MAG TPA: HAMP domain-containing sensor histidine kinase [Fibrobacteria bacterium]|nr:HAMP domain-containing sensor histidine kinase [Fibrobacteria bacterium]
MTSAAPLVELPRLVLVTQDPEWDARYRKALEYFPVADPGTLPGGGAAEAYAVDARHALEFPGMLPPGSDLFASLASAVVISPTALRAEEKLPFYEMGFALVADDKDDIPSTRIRLEAILQGKSKWLTREIINRRLRARIESQQTILTHHNEFLHMAVHDLRSPLAAMICYAELLMDGVLGNLQASQLEPIRTIHRNCQFLIDMVTDLLDSAKIGAGKLQLKLEKVDFNKEVELAAQSLRGLAGAKNISIETDLLPAPEMYLDVQKVSRVLSNILGNAIKFTKAGGKIVVRSRQEGNFLVFSIQDMGPGIPPADLEAIFEKFNSAGGSNVAGKGHGLGLAISKSFVELHGGRLFVESTRHKGSVFIVHLPVEKRKGAARRQCQRRILILDLGKDVPGMADMAQAEVGDFQVDYVSASLRDWSKRQYSRFDFLLINEPSGFEDFGRDYYLLALAGLGVDARCGLLVPADMSEADKEIRRYLGFSVLEKPCTPEELFDKLLGIVGLDRRQKTS